MKKNKPLSTEEKKRAWKTAGRVTLEYILCGAGSLLYAFGVVCFVNPMQFVPGGVTTLALLINHLFPVVPAGVMVFAINVPLMIIAWRVFGFRFIAKTLFSTAVLSVAIDLLTSLGGKYPVLLYAGEEKLVAALFGGIFIGGGVGLAFLCGGTTGGMDIVARLLRLKFPHISMGKQVLFCDLTVVTLAGIVYQSINSVLYSLIVVFLAGIAVDYVVSGRSHSKMLMIMTSFPAEITQDITHSTGRGVTVLDAEGGYTGKPRKMLLCVVRAHEVAEIRKIVKKHDENPFIIITDSGEVLGEGFKSHKDTL
ncbi:MAG: YitT family protein [Clostridia bacterium]|nr:YitT family protein [Clostridia bacterium]